MSDDPERTTLHDAYILLQDSQEVGVAEIKMVSLCGACVRVQIGGAMSLCQSLCGPSLVVHSCQPTPPRS